MIVSARTACASLLLAALGCRLDRDGDGYVGRDDCDDHDPLAYPGAPELCNGLDDDCDERVDEAEDAPLAYPDADGDGYGNEPGDALGCDLPAGWVQRGGDCDDGRADVRPGAPERCDAVDQDCDGIVDEDPDPPLYEDRDADGFGDDLAPVGCVAFAVEVAGDCDDDDPEVRPGAPERCNGIDDDCDGAVDDERDDDGDGSPSCDDCDDDDPDRSPDRVELCNGIDDDCDGVVDPSDAWWDPRWALRVPVRITQGGSDTPVVFDLDARQVLDEGGVGGAFLPGSLRAALQVCDGRGMVELPVAWLDGAWGLDRAGAGVDPAGDERGAVVLLYDLDGDLSTAETLPAAVNVALYLAGPVEPAPFTGGLAASPTSLDAAGVRWAADPSRGGLFSIEAAGEVLGDQAAAARGNGIRTPAGPLSAQDEPGAVTLVDVSPITASLRSETFLANDRGAIEARWTVRRFAGRAEAWVRVELIPTTTTTVEGPDDRTASMRPWQIAAPGELSAAADGSWVDVATGSRGIAWRWLAPPTWITHVERDATDAWTAANDVSDCCVGPVGTVQGGRALVDGGVLEVWGRVSGDGPTWAQRARPLAEIGAPEPR